MVKGSLSYHLPVTKYTIILFMSYCTTYDVAMLHYVIDLINPSPHFSIFEGRSSDCSVLQKKKKKASTELKNDVYNIVTIYQS